MEVEGVGHILTKPYIYIYALHQMVVFLPWSPVPHHCVFFTTGKKIKTDGANSVFSFHSQKIQSGFLSENIAVRPYMCVRADDDETTPNQTKTPGLNWERAVPFVTSPRDDSHHTLSGTRIEHTLRAQGASAEGIFARYEQSIVCRRSHGPLLSFSSVLQDAASSHS